MADSIPVMAFRKMGFKKDLVILTRPEGYRKKQNPMLPLIRRAYREYPEFVETAASRHLVYNRELDEISRLERAYAQAGALRSAVPSAGRSGLSRCTGWEGKMP